MCPMVFILPLAIEKLRNGAMVPTIAPWQMPVRRGAFIAALQVKNDGWRSKKFIPQLASDTEYLKGFHRIGDWRIFL